MSRFVVLLCGPVGAGKTTVAHASGLTVYDRDDPQWMSERHFTANLALLAHDPTVRAVVIRSGATSSARTKACRLVNATHMFLLLTDRAELQRRVRERRRPNMVGELASIDRWLAVYDRDDGIALFPGWSSLDQPLTTSESW